MTPATEKARNPEMPAPAASPLKQVLIDSGFALTAEITPPAATDRQPLLDKALPLKGCADAVNVTDGPGARACMSALVAAGILVETGIDPVLQITCRDRNRIGLQSDLLGAAAVGIRNILVLRGDDPTAGDQPETKPVFDLDALSLLATAASIRDHGALPHGRAVGDPAPFFLGVADMPFDPPPDWKPDRLRAKLEAGAEFVQTQICMDADLVRRYVGRLMEDGLGSRLHLIIGVAAPASARSARWMRKALFGTVFPDTLVERLERAVDQKAEGRRICAEVIQRLTEIPGVAGAHIMAPLNESSIPAVIEDSGIRRRRG